MATLAVNNNKNGKQSFTIFWWEGSRRIGLRLSSRYDKRFALDLKERIEQIQHSRILDRPPDPKLQFWLDNVTEEIRTKLENAGLIEKPTSLTLQELWESFFEGNKQTLKPSTLRSYRSVQNRFFEHFEPTTLVNSLNSDDALRWREMLKRGYAAATVAGTVKCSKRLFNWAVENGLLDCSPFEQVPRGSFKNKIREHFVSMADYARLLEASPDQDWRTLIALNRIGGLRSPSEVLRLKWVDVDFKGRKFVVRASKTEHHAGSGIRIVPLFPKLREEIEKQKEQSNGSVYVIDRWRDTEANLRTFFEEIIFRAGLETWPRLFQNLRASRSNELFSEHPAHIASEWMGQSERTAKNHYLSAQDSDFKKALEE